MKFFNLLYWSGEARRWRGVMWQLRCPVRWVAVRPNRCQIDGFYTLYWRQSNRGCVTSTTNCAACLTGHKLRRVHRRQGSLLAARLGPNCEPLCDCDCSVIPQGEPTTRCVASRARSGTPRSPDAHRRNPLFCYGHRSRRSRPSFDHTIMCG